MKSEGPMPNKPPVPGTVQKTQEGNERVPAGGTQGRAIPLKSNVQLITAV